jgi:putative membrane protein
MTRYHKILFLVFLLVLIWSVIRPVSYREWMLESIPVLGAVPVIFLVGKRYPLSNFSYTLLTIYLCASLLPAHYNVARVPFGKTPGNLLNENRNMYDRLLHFAFGFFCTSSFYEIFIHLLTKKNWLRYFIPFLVIVSFSAVYEILEWLAHLFVAPAASITFVGAQGDLWDPAKDMASAAAGALLMLLALILYDHRKRSLKK